ncbi:unnamed protein product, partial [Hapterophycus canaliculatus]
DRSIALIAPAAAALCLALPRWECYSGGGGGGGGDCCRVRATLYGVLAECMRGAVDLLEMVLVGANRLGQAVSRERLERPRAVIGLAASCILLALRHVGPLSEPPSPPPTPPAPTPPQAGGSTGGGGGGGDSGRSGGGNIGRGEPGPLDAGRSGVAAAGAFVEVLGRALDPRVSEHLGSAALATVMSAVLHCWPPPPPPPRACCDVSGSAGTPPPSAPGATIGAVETGYQRGYAMGWWRLEPDGRLKSADDVVGTGEAAGAAAAGEGAAQSENQGEALEDEFGSMDFLFSPELDAMLGASAPSQLSVQQQATETAHSAAEAAAAVAAAAAAAAEAAAAEAAAIEKEREEIWRSLAVGARTHILPHLNDICRTYTAARYAQGSSSSSSSSAAAAAATAAAAETEAAATRAAVPPRACRTPASIPRTGGEGRRNPSCSMSSGISAISGSSSSLVDVSRVGTGTMLELHASAVLVDLHGSGSGGGRSFGGGGRDASFG